MYKKVLVAVDGSDTGNLALLEAIKLVKNKMLSFELCTYLTKTHSVIVVDIQMR